MENVRVIYGDLNKSAKAFLQTNILAITQFEVNGEYKSIVYVTYIEMKRSQGSVRAIANAGLSEDENRTDRQCGDYILRS